MDIFKVLTRGTKRARPNQQNASISQVSRQNQDSIPSAGQNSTVQLFGKHSAGSTQDSDTNWGKRKRDEFDAEKLPQEIDFFHSKPEARKSLVSTKNHE